MAASSDGYERLRYDWLEGFQRTREHELFMQKGMICWLRLHAEDHQPVQMTNASSVILSESKPRNLISDAASSEVICILANIFRELHNFPRQYLDDMSSYTSTATP